MIDSQLPLPGERSPSSGVLPELTNDVSYDPVSGYEAESRRRANAEFSEDGRCEVVHRWVHIWESTQRVSEGGQAAAFDSVQLLVFQLFREPSL